MSSFAPYVNNGYFDNPICNQYSNQNSTSNPIKVNKYNVNNKIYNTVNNNHDSYELDPNDSYLSQPSASLYTESDTQTSGYYSNMTHQPHGRQYSNQNTRQIVDQSDFADDNKPILRKKEMKPYMEEGFHNGGGHGGRGFGQGHQEGGYSNGRQQGGFSHGHQQGHGGSYYPNPSNLFLGSYFPMNAGGYLDTVSNGQSFNTNIYPVYVEEPPVVIQQPIRRYLPPTQEKQVVYIENVKDDSDSDDETQKPKKNKTVKSAKKSDTKKKISGSTANTINKTSNKTLWLIIIILSIIILTLILYRMYEKKLLKF